MLNRSLSRILHNMIIPPSSLKSYHVVPAFPTCWNMFQPHRVWSSAFCLRQDPRRRCGDDSQWIRNPSWWCNCVGVLCRPWVSWSIRHPCQHFLLTAIDESDERTVLVIRLPGLANVDPPAATVQQLVIHCQHDWPPRCVLAPCPRNRPHA